MSRRIRSGFGDACRVVVLAFAAVASLASAGQSGRGSFRDSGFRSGYGYQVNYRSGTKLVLPSGWVLDNYMRKRSGDLVAKHTGTYITKYRFDGNSDGAIDYEFDELTYALRFEHKVHDGVIWMRSVPIELRLRKKELRVLMQDYIDAVAGGSYETVRLDSTRQIVVLERRYAAHVVDRRPIVLAGRAGYLVTADLANIDQVKVDPNARERRVQLVIVRGPVDHKAPNGLEHPVLVIAGYSNIPDAFERGLADFHDLLRRVEIEGKLGFELEDPPPEKPARVEESPTAVPPVE